MPEMQIPIVDIVFLAIIVLCAVVGLAKGFVNMIFNKAAPLISAWAAILFFKTLASYLIPSVQNEIAGFILSFLIIFVTVFILVKIIQRILGGIFNGVLLNQLNRTLGFVLGIIEGIAIVVILLLILTVQPWFDVSSLLKDSMVYSVFSRFVYSSGITFGSIQSINVGQGQ